MDAVATLVYLYGPPAAGKLTIAEELVARTGFKLFHNHLTVNAVRAVFDFGSPPFVELVQRFRLEIVETAIGLGMDLVFTNNSAWGGHDARTRFAVFAAEMQRTVIATGGSTCFVHVTAPDDALLGRVGADSRRVHRKLVDPVRLREMLDELDASPLHADDLRIDSSTMTPPEAAERIVEALARQAAAARRTRSS